MKSKLTVETAIAPSSWASYLVNGDASGLSEGERNLAVAWIKRQGLGWPVSCDDAGFNRWHDAWAELPLASDCQNYTFLVEAAVG